MTRVTYLRGVQSIECWSVIEVPHHSVLYGRGVRAGHVSALRVPRVSLVDHAAQPIGSPQRLAGGQVRGQRCSVQLGAGQVRRRWVPTEIKGVGNTLDLAGTKRQLSRLYTIFA